MTRCLKILDAICGAGAALAALSFALLALMLIVEVITTSFLSYSQPWAVEYSGYLLAATLFAGVGWTLGQGGHIRVTLLLQFLKPHHFRFADLVISLFALGVAVFVCWALVQNAARSLELGSVSFYPSRTPVWMPQSVLALGWIILCLGLIARVLRLVTGRAPELASEGGHG